jgi:hypothetical protein
MFTSPASLCRTVHVNQGAVSFHKKNRITILNYCYCFVLFEGKEVGMDWILFCLRGGGWCGLGFVLFEG